MKAIRSLSCLLAQREALLRQLLVVEKMDQASAAKIMHAWVQDLHPSEGEALLAHEHMVTSYLRAFSHPVGSKPAKTITVH